MCVWLNLIVVSLAIENFRLNMEMVRKFKTGDLVLCKVGSFPPWPAVVFPQRLLRNDVYRKRKSNCIAVCFFSDPTYYWEQPHKLTPLEPKMIEDFLLQRDVAMSQESLLEAYKEARRFSSLNDFIVNRLKEEDRFGELKKELDRETVLPGEDPFMSKAQSKMRNSASKTTFRNGGKRTTNDNGPSLATDTEHNNNISNDRSDTNGNDDNGKRKKPKLDRSRRIEISLLIRRRLQQNLVQRDVPPSKKEILDSHRLLDKIRTHLFCDPPFFDIEALRESKLHKLLKVIVNDPELKEFHSICKEILVQWIDIISELKSEKSVSDENQQRKQRSAQDPPAAETTIV